MTTVLKKKSKEKEKQDVMNAKMECCTEKDTGNERLSISFWRWYKTIKGF